MDTRNKNRVKITFSFSHLLTRKGFTLLELLTCLIVLAVFITIVAANTGRFGEDLKIAAALKDMKTIQAAIVNKLYPDFGYIPCGAGDGDTDERKRIEALFIPAYLFLERGEIRDMIPGVEECMKEGYIGEWDKYASKGWQGPYLASANSLFDATYFDKTGFPKTDDGNVWLPTLQTPWAESCEEMAREAEAEGDLNLAKKYRKGKYYQIFYPQLTLAGFTSTYGWNFNFEWKPTLCQIPRSGACIVCRGSDCLPPEKPGIDVATFLGCEAAIREEAVSTCKPGCKSVGELKACVKEIYENEYPGCYQDGEAVPWEKRLGITVPENKYYMDIGDDIVMSLSGMVIRSPMEK